MWRETYSTYGMSTEDSTLPAAASTEVENRGSSAKRRRSSSTGDAAEAKRRLPNGGVEEDEAIEDGEAVMERGVEVKTKSVSAEERERVVILDAGAQYGKACRSSRCVVLSKGLVSDFPMLGCR